MKKTLLLAMLLSVCGVHAQDVQRERPIEWEGLVYGGRFMDRFQAMKGSVLSDKVWGTDKVRPRFIDNGIEDDTFSYWGGNILYRDGKYHLFVCGWLENSPAGHHEWKRSMVFHTVSDSIDGPYKNIGMVGFGHNPEIYQTDDGMYVISASVEWNPYYYISMSINGPWKQHKLEMDSRDRKIIEGTSNLTFTKREDGSVIMVCRGGGIWISRNGTDVYEQITCGSVYPKRVGRFEDPVIWRDNVQYHLIVNDWLGRVAYYMRSKDGVNWVEDSGEAYTPGIAFHDDGKIEDWYKFERIKVFQDEYGRAYKANFAVCDTLKNYDLGDDNHSSKNVIIPLNRGMLMNIEDVSLKAGMKSVKVRIRGEKGFNPVTDINVKSLRFGCSKDVNYGKGCKCISAVPDGTDMVVTFNTKGYIIPDDEFAPKVLGKDVNGRMIYGYARNPNVNFNPSILSSRKPYADGNNTVVEIKNFGQVSSPVSSVSLECEGSIVATGEIPSLSPYAKTDIVFRNLSLPEGKSCNVVISGRDVVQPEESYTIE